MTRCYRNCCKRALRRPAVESSGTKYPTRLATAAFARIDSWGFVSSSITAIPMAIPMRRALQVCITATTTASAPQPIKAIGAEVTRSMGYSVREKVTYKISRDT